MPKDSNSKNQQDRSVHIGSAKNVQINSGDDMTVNTVFQGQQVVITKQEVIKALKEVNEILATAELDSNQQKELEEALAEAEAEALKDKPEKGKISQVLEKAVTIAKGAANAKELLVLAVPVVQKVALWLGDAGSNILSMLKLN